MIEVQWITQAVPSWLSSKKPMACLIFSVIIRKSSFSPPLPPWTWWDHTIGFLFLKARFKSELREVATKSTLKTAASTLNLWVTKTKWNLSTPAIPRTWLLEEMWAKTILFCSTKLKHKTRLKSLNMPTSFRTRRKLMLLKKAKIWIKLSVPIMEKTFLKIKQMKGKNKTRRPLMPTNSNGHASRKKYHRQQRLRIFCCSEKPILQFSKSLTYKIKGTKMFRSKSIEENKDSAHVVHKRYATDKIKWSWIAAMKSISHVSRIGSQNPKNAFYAFSIEGLSIFLYFSVFISFFDHFVVFFHFSDSMINKIEEKKNSRRAENIN